MKPDSTDRALCSTTDPTLRISWRQGVLQGLSPDGGLLLPVQLPEVPSELRANGASLTFPELAAALAQLFLDGELPAPTLTEIAHTAFSFPVPLTQIDPHTFVLELFHGPTCAFKDFGARFMARLFRTFLGSPRRPLTVLVATSGDTGSAVADAFLDTQPNPPIRVAILFPRGRVSLVQEKQMTTLGHNVTAFEVEGTFDDCQRLVKLALADPSLREETPLTSANSINIARLLPQLFYYAHAIRQLAQRTPGPPIISVPSGNLGNLTGALLAHMLGFRAAHFIAACNHNATFPEFLAHGKFSPRLAQETLSNAMDVGNPSNFARILSLYEPHPERLRTEISGTSCSDRETLSTMQQCFESCGYLLDPHTAVGVWGLQQYRAQSQDRDTPGLVVATAHPAKFSAAVEQAVGFSPEFPPQLERVLHRPSHKIPLPAQYEALVPALRQITSTERD